MSDALETIHKIIEAHHRIRENVMATGGLVSDFEALFSLQRAQSGWAVSSVEELAKVQERLQESIRILERGLGGHFSIEEKALPPLFGEMLMKALLLEHREIRQALDDVKSLLAETSLDKLNRADLLARKSQIHGKTSNITQLIEAHASKEEVILKMLECALKEEETGAQLS